MPRASRSASVGLIGDFDPRVTAHRAIPSALERAAESLGAELHITWLHTTGLREPLSDGFARYSGLWCVPATPYADTEAALQSIRLARESGRPFLGTCGGFQHALLEYARSVLGVAGAAHAELDPAADDPFIAPLDCPLVERTGPVRLIPGTRIARAYGTLDIVEEYHCAYGLSAAAAARLQAGPLRISARDAAGDVRAVELDDHPFFVATLFQSERRALRGEVPPVVRAFLDAAAA